jgi:hypothetical protein
MQKICYTCGIDCSNVTRYGIFKNPALGAFAPVCFAVWIGKIAPVVFVP